MARGCRALLLLALVMTGMVALVPGGPGRPANAQTTASAVTDLRLGDHGDKTRYVIEMTMPLDFRLFTLENPRRLVIDFPPLDWQAVQPSGAGVGLIGHYAHERQESGTSRIVLELTQPARVRDAFFLPPNGATPYRFVLDLEPVDAEDPGQVPAIAAAAAEPGTRHSGGAIVAAAAAVPPGSLAADPLLPSSVNELIRPASIIVPSPAMPLPRPRPEASAQRVIAIDAGHGGIDPGAVGVSGLMEKDITLSVARALRDVLEATGRYQVFLTRDDDRHLKLRERVALARKAKSDLFISLHADSIDDEGVHGGSVYTLSDVASDKEAAMLAARENRADALAGVQLDPEDDIMASILIDLAQRLTQNESKMFADMAVDTLKGEIAMLNNAHRQAGFAVLKAPDVPSILVELGYLSNETDEDRLRSGDHQNRIAQGLAEAIDSYFSWLDGEGRS